MRWQALPHCRAHNLCQDVHRRFEDHHLARYVHCALRLDTNCYPTFHENETHCPFFFFLLSPSQIGITIPAAYFFLFFFALNCSRTMKQECGSAIIPFSKHTQTQNQPSEKERRYTGTKSSLLPYLITRNTLLSRVPKQPKQARPKPGSLRVSHVIS